MIYSRVLNFIVLILGIGCLIFGINEMVACIQLYGMNVFRRPSSFILGVTLFGLGLWCAIGALNNLFRLSRNEPENMKPLHNQTMISYSIAKWHLIVLLVSGIIMAIFWWLGVKSALFVNYIFVFAFFAIPITVIFHLSRRKRS